MRLIHRAKYRILAVLFCLSCLSGALALAQPGQYIFTTIDAPFAGTFQTHASGINDEGTIAGSYFTTDGPPSASHGFLRSNGTFTSYDLCTSPCATGFSGINNQGDVVGAMTPGEEVGFLFSGGQVSTISVPGSTFTAAYGINNASQIVGQTVFPGEASGFLLDQGTFSFLSGMIRADGINDGEQIVGTGFGGHGFLLSDGVLSSIDYPGASTTNLHGINKSGVIVGDYQDLSGTSHGFVLDQGVYSNLDFPGPTISPFGTIARGINNLGEIVGDYTDSTGTHGFLARPATVVNGLVHLDSVTTSFDDTPVPGGPAGTFTITATFKNTSSTPIHDPIFRVTQLTGEGPSQTLFVDHFDGPDLNPIWQPALPDALTRFSDGIATYLGASGFSFQSLDGRSVIRLQNTLDNAQRRGWSSSTTFPSDASIVYEARFNTVVQSPSTGIDELLEIWLLDSDSLARYDKVALSAPEFGSGRVFTADSTITNAGLDTDFAFTDNTWYRMVLRGSMTQEVRASIYNDAGTVELIGVNLGHNLTAYPSGFKIGISQSMGGPGSPFPTDVALDSVRVTAKHGNLLLNADGGPGGVGALLTPNVGDDSILSPNESFTTAFVIGLQVRHSFTFFVDLLGLAEP